jgi:inositol transport system permease protein
MQTGKSVGKLFESKFLKPIKSLSKNGVVIIFVGIIIIMAILTRGKSLAFSNITNIMMQATTIGLVAIGMTLVIIDRGIDLSVGGIAALSSAIVS